MVEKSFYGLTGPQRYSAAISDPCTDDATEHVL